MTSFSLPLSSLSLCFPKSSVPYLGLRPPPAPPPEPLSPPTPPEPPDPPDPQICSSSGETHAQSLIFQHLTSPQRVLRDSEPPSPSQPPLRLGSPFRKSIPMSIAAFAPPRSSCRRWMLISRFSKVKLGFHCLGQNLVLCLVGQKWMGDLLGQMWRVLFLGSTSPTPSPLLSLYHLVSGLITLESSSPIKPRLLLNFVAINDACSFITPSIPFTQVRSCYSLSNSSTLGSYWMVFESVALALWNSGIVLTPVMFLDNLGSTLVLSGGTLIALVRNFTAVCRFYFELASFEVALWQIGKRSLLSSTVPVILVHRGFHSPHLSFKELIILPNTSLVFSGIVIGSIVVKTVLLGAEARIVVQDGSRSANADWLTLEALFLPPCGFGKDYLVEAVCFIACPWLDSVLVELLSSPLSLSFYWSFVVSFSLSSYSITLLIVVFDVSALCCLDVFSFNGV